VDLTEDEEDMLVAPATPPPHVSDEDEMETAEENELPNYGMAVTPTTTAVTRTSSSMCNPSSPHHQQHVHRAVHF